MHRKGFTLIEILIFTAIFAFAMVAILGILVVAYRVQNNQSSATEVAQQGQSLMQKIQYYVQGSSVVDIPQDVSTATLKLWLGIAIKDPTYFTLASGTVYFQQTATGTLQALTSNKVTVSNLSFVRHANPPAHDTVSVSFTIAYNSTNPLQAISELFQTSIARVSAATFDSNIVPSSTATYNVGVAGSIWSSINQTIYFSGSKVGIGTASPQSTLDVAGNETIGSYAGATAAPSNGLIVSGNVGIGTSSAASTLTVVGTSFFSATSTFLGKIFVGTSTVSTYNLDVASNGSTTARFGLTASDTIVIGGGAGKVTAGTYDPAYVIDGVGFATFLPGMTGEKEETVGTVVLSRAAAGYHAVIDFGATVKGSDLWLFRKVIDASGNFAYVNVFLTPSFDGKVWYEKDAANNRIVIHGSSAGEVSYQLIGRRFDWLSWPNNTGAADGIVVPASN